MSISQKIKKQYSSLEEERLDIEKEAIYIKEKVFGQTWDSVGDRWKEEFNSIVLRENCNN